MILYLQLFLACCLGMLTERYLQRRAAKRPQSVRDVTKGLYETWSKGARLN